MTSMVCSAVDGCWAAAGKLAASANNTAALEVRRIDGFTCFLIQLGCGMPPCIQAETCEDCASQPGEQGPALQTRNCEHWGMVSQRPSRKALQGARPSRLGTHEREIERR